MVANRVKGWFFVAQQLFGSSRTNLVNKVYEVLQWMGVKKNFGRFLASILDQVWRNITKNTKKADFKKIGPPVATNYSSPWPPWLSWGSKKFGRFLASILAQVGRNITKNTKYADLKKTGPQLPPITVSPLPPTSPGGQKIFWEVSGIYLCPTHPIWPKKLGRITSFGRIDAWRLILG